MRWMIDMALYVIFGCGLAVFAYLDLHSTYTGRTARSNQSSC